MADLQNSLRLKGENNLLVKKYSNQAKEIETLKEEISTCFSCYVVTARAKQRHD